MKKIYLSASTQENNRGVGNYGNEEHNMFILRDRTEYFIKNGGFGHEFDIKKNINKNWSLEQIVSDSNINNVDIHMAFHTNAGVTGARGCEVYHHYKNTGTGLKLATLWYNEISKITPTADRGVKKDNTVYASGNPLYETSKTKAAAALCEFIFHSNIDDVLFFLKNVDNFAIGTAKAVYNLYGYKFTLPVVKPVATNKTYDVILKEVSKYSDTWIKFIKQHPEVNLKGLIETLYYYKSK